MKYEMHDFYWLLRKQYGLRKVNLAEKIRVALAQPRNLKNFPCEFSSINKLDNLISKFRTFIQLWWDSNQ